MPFDRGNRSGDISTGAFHPKLLPGREAPAEFDPERTEIDVDQPAPDYKIGWRDNGRTTFSGGHLREVTANFTDGLLGIPNAPKYFRAGDVFRTGQPVRGGHSATMLRAEHPARPCRRQSGHRRQRRRLAVEQGRPLRPGRCRSASPLRLMALRPLPGEAATGSFDPKRNLDANRDATLSWLGLSQAPPKA